jgi:hypothetical protein
VGVSIDKRTLTVLASLIGGMTLAGGLLLVLEPGPVAPLSHITLYSTDQTHTAQPEDRLFDLDQAARPWRGIVIHDTGSLHGSARNLNRLHEQANGTGLGYHFVINNGTGEEDGLIEVGFRWQKQFVGAYIAGESAEQWNNRYIGIALVGNADQRPLTRKQLRELVWLIQQLQARFDIPRSEVYAALGSSDEQLAAHFPHAWFRRQLHD